MNPNLNVELLGSPEVARLNVYLHHAELILEPRPWRKKAKAVADLEGIEVLLTFRLTVIGSGDTHGGSLLLSSLLAAQEELMRVRVCLLGQKADFFIGSSFTLVSIGAPTKSSDMEFKAMFRLGTRVNT